MEYISVHVGHSILNGTRQYWTLNFYFNINVHLITIPSEFQMVASAAGHVETAVVLARWSAGTRAEAGAPEAAAAARLAGHNNLANLLDRIHPPTKDGVFLKPNR